MARLFPPEERTAQVARQFPKRAESAAKSEPSVRLFLPEPLEQPFPSERAKAAAKLAREFPLKKSGLVYLQFPKTKSERAFLSEQVVQRFPKMQAAMSEPSAREFPLKRSEQVCLQFPKTKTEQAFPLEQVVRQLPKMQAAMSEPSAQAFPPKRSEPVCLQFPKMKMESAAKLARSGLPCLLERSARAVRRFPKMRGAESGRTGRRLRERGRTGLFCPRFAVRPKAATAWKNRCRKA